MIDLQSKTYRELISLGGEGCILQCQNCKNLFFIPEGDRKITEDYSNCNWWDQEPDLINMNPCPSCNHYDCIPYSLYDYILEAAEREGVKFGSILMDNSRDYSCYRGMGRCSEHALVLPGGEQVAYSDTSWGQDFEGDPYYGMPPHYFKNNKLIGEDFYSAYEKYTKEYPFQVTEYSCHDNVNNKKEEYLTLPYEGGVIAIYK